MPVNEAGCCYYKYLLWSRLICWRFHSVRSGSHNIGAGCIELIQLHMIIKQELFECQRWTELPCRGVLRVMLSPHYDLGYHVSFYILCFYR